MPLKLLHRYAVDFADLYPSAFQIARDAEMAPCDGRCVYDALLKGLAQTAPLSWQA